MQLKLRFAEEDRKRPPAPPAWDTLDAEARAEVLRLAIESTWRPANSPVTHAKRAGTGRWRRQIGRRPAAGHCLLRPLWATVAHPLSRPHRDAGLPLSRQGGRRRGWVHCLNAGAGRSMPVAAPVPLFYQSLGGKADHVPQQICFRGLLHERELVHHVAGHRWFRNGLASTTKPHRKAPMTTDTPATRYSATNGALASGFIAAGLHDLMGTPLAT